MTTHATAKVIVIVGGSALLTLVPMAIIAAMPAMGQAFGSGTDGEFLAKMILSIPAILTAVSAPMAGAAAGRFGVRPILLAALALFAASGVLGLVAPSLSVLIASRVLMGIAAGAAAALAITVVGDFGEEAREKLVGASGAAGTVASIVGLLLGGWLVDSAGWRAPFAMYLLAVPVLVAAWLGVRGGPAPAAADGTGTVGGGVGGALRLLWPCYLVMLVLALGFFTPTVQVPFLLADQGVASATRQSVILLAFALSSMVWAVSYARLRRVLDIRVLAALCLACLGVAALVLGGMRGEAWVAAGLVVAGFGGGLANPVINSAVLDRAPAAIRPTALGLVVSTMFVGQFLTPLVFQPFQAALGMYGAMLTIGAALLAAALAGFALGFGRAPARAVTAG